MRFSATFSDQGSIETFSRCLTGIARLCKKRCAVKVTPAGLCFIASAATGLAGKDGVDYWAGVLVPFRPAFRQHSFVGASEEHNAFLFEVGIDDLVHCLSNYADTKLKLINRNKHPHLQVEVLSLNVTHTIPITMVQSRKWSIFDMPQINSWQCCVVLPPMRTILRVLTSLRNMNTKFVTVKVSNAGEMRLEATTRNGEISVEFTDLDVEIGDDAPEPSQQLHWFATRLLLKPLHLFFSSFQFTNRMKLCILSEKTAHLSVKQEDFEIALFIGDSAE